MRKQTTSGPLLILHALPPVATGLDAAAALFFVDEGASIIATRWNDSANSPETDYPL